MADLITNLGDIGEEAIRMLVGVFESFADNAKSKPGFHGEFISENKVLSRKHTGFCMTGRRNLSNKLSYQNALIVGSTGTGKSANIIIPTCMTIKNASLIINDPSGELKLKLGGFFQRENFDVKTFNLADMTASSGYNFIKRAQTSQEIHKISHMLIEGGQPSQSKDKFWEQMAGGLAANLIGIVKTLSPEFHTLFQVRQLLNALGANPKGVDELFRKNADDILFAEYLSFKSLDEKIRTSTIATAKAALQIFSDTNVATLTSFDTLEFSDFRKKPTVLFVQTSIGDSRYYSGLISIFYQQFITELLSRFAEPGERDIFFLLDEASSLKIPILPLACANLRKHNAGVMLLVQSEQQLISNFGRADGESIMANCYSKLYLTGQDLDTTKKLESLLGKTEIVDEDGKKSLVPLLAADTIRTLSANKAILLCGHHRPVLATMYPYYENSRYRQNSKLQLTPTKSQIPFDEIPLFTLETPDDDED